MKETGIIFTGESIPKILAGLQTQTRRIIKLQPDKILQGDWVELCSYGVVGDRLWVKESWRCMGGGSLRNIIYRAEGDSVMSFCGIDDGRTEILHVPESHWAEWNRLVYETSRSCNWCSPIHMPKWAARLWLEIMKVRVERVQEISEEDAKAEGVVIGSSAMGHIFTAKEHFKGLWDSLNAKPKCCKHNPYTGARENCYAGYPWENIRKEKILRSGLKEYIVGNPFVCPIDFKKIQEKPSL